MVGRVTFRSPPSPQPSDDCSQRVRISALARVDLGEAGGLEGEADKEGACVGREGRDRSQQKGQGAWWFGGHEDRGREAHDSPTAELTTEEMREKTMRPRRKATRP